MFLSIFNKIFRTIINALRKILYVTGLILIYIGSNLIHKKKRYMTIIYIIEHLLSSSEVFIKVINVENSHKLFVRFNIELMSSNYNRINWRYLLFELVIQMGCNFTDVTYDYVKKKGDYYMYQIDITRTAIETLEKGTTHGTPLFFEERDAQWYIKNVLQLVEDTPDITPESVMKKLHVSRYHASEMLEQIKKAGIKKQVNTKRLMN